MAESVENFEIIDYSTVSPDQIWNKVKKSINIVNYQKQSYDAPFVPNKIRVICISDTHNRIPEKNLPNAHILIHAGDLTRRGKEEEIENLRRYLSSLNHIKHKVIIAGNHDLIFDQRFQKNATLREKAKSLLKDFHYLEDSAITLYGIKIYGSPWQPMHSNNAFQEVRGPSILSKWQKIPSDTDILVTHGPPLGIGDNYSMFKHAGCYDLLRTVRERVKPKFHIFGHIHSGYGCWNDGTTTYINASICNNSYNPVNEPILFDIDPKNTFS